MFDVKQNKQETRYIMSGQHVFCNLEKSHGNITNHELFLKNKMRPFYKSGSVNEEYLDMAVKNPTNIVLPMRYGTLDELNNSEYAVSLTNSMVEYISNRFYFEDGEELIVDTVSCLTEDINGFPTGTTILKRETNKCVFYYINPQFVVNNNTLIDNSSDFEQYKFSDEEPDYGAAMLVELATDMLNFGIDDLGAKLLTLIFGDEEEIQFKELQKVFAQIVKDANIEQTVNEQGGKINAVLLDMLEFYKNVSDKADYINDRLADLNASVEILWKEEFRKKGLPTYLGGQELSFAILHEQYKVTGKETIKQTIIDRAKRISENVIDEHKVLLKERLDQVTEVEPWPVPEHNRARYYFEDKFTGDSYSEETKICFNEKDEDVVIAKITKIRDELISKLTKDMDWIKDVSEKLNELQQYPLGDKPK